MGKKSEFKRVVRDGHAMNIKEVAGGEVVRRSAKRFDAFDDKNRHLGTAYSRLDAEYMVRNGFAKDVWEAPELALWAAWDYAVTSGGADVLEDEEGNQYVRLPGGFVFKAERYHYQYRVSLVTIDDFYLEHWDDAHNTLRLKYADDAFVIT